MRRVSGENDPDGVLRCMGFAIRSARKEREISQEALADAAQLDRSHMGRIERGERNVTILNFGKIATALDLTMAELLARAEL
ncbi:helix-turn-helix transcriptional regulator [Pontixanthobacter sp. CEM42]|uniref:helix-turn-helix domain-containing protein n=1 Tax=Pontixanthobacter sp. CEM42 TaxID=2792077 RepID=UPI001AE02C60|nr:helix-turn-helix transcriptional regulator [Pontixanthobacter sp. CEM42]